MNEEDIGKRIGSNIQRCRGTLNISQGNLASKIKMSQSQLSEYEKGKKCPNVSTLVNIAEGLGVSLDDLYYGPSSSRPITTAHSEAEEIANCFASLAEKGFFEISHYSYGGKNDYEEGMQLVVCKYEDVLKDLLSDLEKFKSKSTDYPDAATVKKNILCAATKSLERLSDKGESKFDDELPF